MSSEFPQPRLPRRGDLRQVFNPRSIAVVGATDNPGKWGYWLARGALKGKGRREVFLVSTSRPEVHGERTFRSLGEISGGAELVALAIPLSTFDETLDDALAFGAKAILAVNAGFAEAGAVGRARQDQMVAKVRDADGVLVGPNCIGFVDNTTGVELAWLGLLSEGSLPSGPIAVVSQSGGVASEIISALSRRGVGVSRFVGVGNQADLTIADYVRALISHEETRIVAIYCEDFRDGRALFDAVHTVTTAGKVVIVLAATGEIGSRAAHSHTGALASDAVVVGAACRAAGALLVSSTRELIDAAEVMAKVPRPRGRRVGILSDGGGHAVLGGEILHRAGLDVVPFSAELAAELTAALDPSATTTNPVDFAAANSNVLAFPRAVELVGRSGEVDAIFLAGGFGAMALSEQFRDEEVTLTKGMVANAATNDLPLVVQSHFGHSPSVQAARDAGAPCFSDIAAAARAFAHTSELCDASPEGVPELPEPLVPQPLMSAYLGARELLTQADIAFPDGRQVLDAHQGVNAAAELGYPVALKAVGVAHKSDVDGVALGINDEPALVSAFDDMQRRMPNVAFWVERMVMLDQSVELIIGCRRDPHFGPLLLMGLGGIYAELHNDIAISLAPVSVGACERMLRGLKSSPLLTGARGRQPVAIERVAQIASTLSRIVSERTWISDLEINPLLVGRSEVVALDAHLVLSPHQ